MVPFVCSGGRRGRGRSRSFHPPQDLAGEREVCLRAFRRAIEIERALSKDKVSPKIVDYFNSVKTALVGYLAVSSQPAGAKVTLNGEFLSLTDFFPLEILAGDYTVEIAREGYRTESRPVSIDEYAGVVGMWGE